MATTAQPGFKKYSVYVDPRTDACLEKLAELDLGTKTSVIRRALRDYVKSRDDELQAVGFNVDNGARLEERNQTIEVAP